MSFKQWKAEWGGRLYCSHGKSNARGAMILIKRRTGIKVLLEKTDNWGRYILLKCKVNWEEILLGTCMAPIGIPQIFTPTFFRL